MYMDILALFNAFKEQLQSLQAALQDAQAASEQLAQEQYAKGFADGVASVPPPVNDKIYSQEELDQAVRSALAPVEEQVAAMRVQIEGLGQQILELQNNIDSAKADAVAAFKAELLAKYEEQQVAESQGETGFGDLLR
jgi:chromosome segregation ATPase